MNVSTPRSLDELLEATQIANYALSAQMPTYGGTAPADTWEVWSWDADRVLVGSCVGELEIVGRDEWEVGDE